MSLVHDALQTLTAANKQSHLTLAPAAALICCLALLGGCGGSSHSKTGVAASAPGVGSSLRLDNCADWKRATAAERRDTVLALRRFAGGPVGSSAGIQNGPVLDNDRAYQLLQRACADYFARGFKLYKLYTHAAAFLGR